ncbi:MAG: 1-acyl-sn-glycerol-3-phosphate acyltransferase, partial [Elusimicrobia bacterium]|nr:1-acyl-sn-glycerol-3-phosphate acyltransferase [Elusimicrobiota bacterium]
MKFIIKLLFNKRVVAPLLKLFFSIQVNGLENIKDLKGNVLFIANHNSFIDAVLIWAFVPENLCFTINPIIARKWYVKSIMNIAKF